MLRHERWMSGGPPEDQAYLRHILEAIERIENSPADVNRER